MEILTTPPQLARSPFPSTPEGYGSPPLPPPKAASETGCSVQQTSDSPPDTPMEPLSANLGTHRNNLFLAERELLKSIGSPQKSIKRRPIQEKSEKVVTEKLIRVGLSVLPNLMPSRALGTGPSPFG